MQESRLLLRLIEQPECEWVEFKESWFEPHSVGRYVSALANGARLANRPAGYLVWGISNAREVVGTTFDPFTQRVGNQPFELWLKSQITPAGHGIRFISFEHYGLQVVILEIGTAEGVPTRFDGAPSIRVGEATPRLDAHPDREKRLLEALVQTSFEGTWAREDVTGDEVFELLDVDHALSLLTQRPEATSTDERLDQLENFRLIQQASPTYWAISNGAAILFARSFAEFGDRFQRRATRVVFYGGDDRTRPSFEQPGTRGYALDFEGMFEGLERQLPRSEQLQGVRREDHPLYPIDALRELVANALVHQDFSVTGAGPMIEVFDNRIEITNPGTSLVAVDRLLDEPPQSRNERLAFLMRQMGYCEERGSGIDKVVRLAEVFQLPAPSFEKKTNGFMATLFAPRGYDEMSSDERTRACYQNACLLWVSGGRRMTNSTLRSRFGLADNQASKISRLINDALEARLIKSADPANRSRAQASYQPYWA